MAHHLENFILITLPVENNRERTWQVTYMAIATRNIPQPIRHQATPLNHLWLGAL
jgi:hypothetical protein